MAEEAANSYATNKFMKPQEAYNNTGASVLNIRYGGQWGYAPNLREIESSTSYVTRDLTVLLVRPPKMFSLFNGSDPKKWTEGLRSLVETHAYSITGFNSTLTLETSAYDVGAGGEQMKAVVDAKRTPTDLTFNFRELDGQPISRFLESWIRIGIWDPDTNHPLIADNIVKMKSVEKKDKFAQYLYDLARLNQNMLKGEELSRFIKNSPQ